MRTWEMIKELTENPDKKFRRVGEDRELYVGVYNNFVAWEGDYALETGEEPFEIYTDLEWEEVKQPVDFMTAIASGKRIKVEHDILPKGSWVTKLSELAGFIDDLSAYCSRDIREILLRGKWYIED